MTGFDDYGGFGNVLGTSQQLGADTSCDAPDTAAHTNAVQAVSGGADSSHDQWSGFFKDLISTGVGYAIAKDAARSGLTQPGGSGAAPAPSASTAARPGLSPLLLLLAGGVVVFIAVKAAKG